MAQSTISDEDLMAYADGQAEAAMTLRIDAALPTDDGLAARLAVFVESRPAVHAALGPRLRDPLPEALVASVREMAARSDAAVFAQAGAATVIFLVDRRRLRPALLVPGALAATVLLGLGFGAGQWVRPAADAVGPSPIAALADPVLLQALDRIPTGEAQPIGEGDTFRRYRYRRCLRRSRRYRSAGSVDRQTGSSSPEASRSSRNCETCAAVSPRGDVRQPDARHGSRRASGRNPNLLRPSCRPGQSPSTGQPKGIRPRAPVIPRKPDPPGLRAMGLTIGLPWLSD